MDDLKAFVAQHPQSANIPSCTTSTALERGTMSSANTGKRIAYRMKGISAAILFAVVSFASLVPVSAASPVTPLPPMNVNVRSVDGVAVVTWKKVTGRLLPIHYKIYLDDQQPYFVYPPEQPRLVLTQLTLDKVYTVRVSANYSLHPEQTTAPIFFTPQAASPPPSVKFTLGLGIITFEVNTKQYVQPAPVHGWRIRFMGREVFTKTGRGTFTGFTDSTQYTCSGYELWTLYSLGERSTVNPYYQISDRYNSTEIVCPLRFEPPFSPGFAEQRIENGVLYLTLSRNSRYHVDQASVSYDSRTYRIRSVNAEGYSFKIKLRSGFTCRDKFQVSFSNRLGTVTETTSLGYAPKASFDPATCIAAGATKIREIPDKQ